MGIVSISGSATSSIEQKYDTLAYTVILLKSDAPIGSNTDIQFGFNDSISKNNYITLKPNEELQNLKTLVTKLYYKCTTGSANFRFIGYNSKFDR
jgi:hypothetical protein